MRRGIKLGFLLLALALPAAARVDRVVILKIDGLPPALMRQHKLPAMERIFGQGGAQLDNFYVRGLSLSAASWSLLDTGRPLEIKGNVEYDRYTLRPYDYLNFVPFFFSAAASKRVDMRGVEVLDEAGIPLLADRFDRDERHPGFQLLQRGVRWDTLESALKRSVAKAPKSLLDEWLVGFSITDSLDLQYEHDLLMALKEPKVRYLDYFTGAYDHTAHLTGDPVSQGHELQALDAMVGRIWAAIGQSPYPNSTALILVSDHGMNTSPTIFSQGYNLVDWFNSRAGGAHHVLTNRHPLSEFKVRGLDPFVSAVVTPSNQSSYLAKQGDEYPTVMLDLDGNERASIGLRNNTFNVLHVFLDQLTRRTLPGPTRVATLDAFFQMLESVRNPWMAEIVEIDRLLTDLDTRIADLRQIVLTFPRKWTKTQIAQGVDKDARRQARQLEMWLEERRDYTGYAATLRRLLALTPADFDPGRFKISELIPERSLGPLNTPWDLQNYVTGPGPNGFVLTGSGAFDWDRNFQRMNYPAALQKLTVRNNVQAEVSAEPVDFTVVATVDGLWLSKDAEHQALIQTRRTARGAEHRYLPIANLTGQLDGSVKYQNRTWAAGFPLAFFEDPNLQAPRAWLEDWHTEAEWLTVTHQTRYSTAVIGLTEQLLDSGAGAAYQKYKRLLRRTDLLVFSNDHWNFNVRGFNPGGNHGSFLRDSTHSVFMIAGGEQTGVPRGAHIQTPYDSLSFLPTILTLMDRPEADLPGPVIQELLPAR
ncbi:MAG: alkaline phosphatase family protein [Acidobacteriota bacterium]